jgi:hypothetical protein
VAALSLPSALLVKKSPFHSLILVFGEPTAQAGENAVLNSYHLQERSDHTF